MTRVLIVDTGREWGGGTQSLLALVQGLAGSIELTAAFSHDYRRGDGEQVSAVLERLGVKFVHLPRPALPSWAKWFKEVLRLLLFFIPAWRRAAIRGLEFHGRTRPEAVALTAAMVELAPDLVYGNNQPSSNLGAMLAAEAAGVPMVLHCRKAVPLSARERAVTNRVARRVICVSPSLRDHYLQQGIRAELCRVIPNGIDSGLRPTRDAGAMRQLLGLPADACVVGSVGSLLSLKRLDMLLDAFALAVTTVPGLRCVIVGAGPMEQAWRARAERLGIAPAVLFAGFRTDALDCINTFDIFVLSSQQEGMPRVILEAMLMGKPVVATDVVGTRDVVRDGGTGYLVALDDAPAMAQRLMRLAESASLRTRLGDCGRRWVQAEFSLAHYATAVAAVFAEARA
jgi:glycosyltransferase involved in cell wall biosynthesis